MPLAVMYVDHNVLQIDDKNMQDHRYLRSFSQRYGLLFSPPGHGISHYVHLERFARPGALLVGADSHSTMAGAVGMFATGAGGLEVAVAMAGLRLRPALPAGGRGRADGPARPRRRGQGRDPGAAAPPRGARRPGRGLRVLRRRRRRRSRRRGGRRSATWSSRPAPPPGVFPADDETRALARRAGPRRTSSRRWPRTRARATTRSSGSTCPRSSRWSRCRRRRATSSRSPRWPAPRVVQVCVGSSVNSSYEDLATVAAVLRDRSVRPGRAC